MVFDKEQLINTIIEGIIEKQYNLNPEKFLQENTGKTLDDLKQELYQIYKESSRYLLETDKEFYDEISNNRVKFREFYTLVYEIHADPITTTLGGVIIYLVYKNKYVGRILDWIKHIINRTSKWIYDKTLTVEISRLFTKYLTPECIRELKNLARKIPYSKINDIEYIKKVIERELKSSIVGVTRYRLEKFGESEEKFTTCVINALIQSAGVTLMLFYKCLFDSKRFLDLINIKKLPADTILSLDRLSPVNTVLSKTPSNCIQYYNDFQQIVKVINKLVTNFYPHNLQKQSEFTENLIKAINEANKYAQKLLDEGKKKQEQQNKR